MLMCPDEKVGGGERFGGLYLSKSNNNKHSFRLLLPYMQAFTIILLVFGRFRFNVGCLSTIALRISFIYSVHPKKCFITCV